MILLDRPYVSEHLLGYLATSGQAVLSTPFTRALAAGRAINLVDDAEAERRCRAGERLYTSSENALDWVQAHLGDLPLARHVAVMKDKAALRRTLAPICPGFLFREVPAADLAGLDIADWPRPFVLKPSVGFFSLGVHTVASLDDWRAAVAAIEDDLREQRQAFPASVVDQSTFLIEAYIQGDEFAVDVYFDSQGEPVILNIFAHRFASLSDVSDRLYYTSKDVIEQNRPRFEAFFRQANALMGVRDFPAHVELRVQDGRILPIEFNALRFAGLCTTDLADLAYGINTIDCYLNDRRPDFDAVLRDREGKTYSMIILDKPAGLPPSDRFDYDALAARFQRILELRRLDSPDLPVFGFLFTETDAAHAGQLDAILRSDLTEFLR